MPEASQKFLELLTEEHLDIMADVVDEDVARILQSRVQAEAVERQVQQRLNAKSAASNTGRRLKAAAASSRDGQPAASHRTRNPLFRQTSRAEVGALCPYVKSVPVTRDDLFDHCWEIGHPTGQAPHSASKAWSVTGDDHGAVMHCLRWAWTQHQKKHPEIEILFFLTMSIFSWHCQWPIQRTRSSWVASDLVFVSQGGTGHFHILQTRAKKAGVSFTKKTLLLSNLEALIFFQPH